MLLTRFLSPFCVVFGPRMFFSSISESEGSNEKAQYSCNTFTFCFSDGDRAHLIAPFLVTVRLVSQHSEQQKLTRFALLLNNDAVQLHGGPEHLVPVVLASLQLGHEEHVREQEAMHIDPLHLRLLVSKAERTLA